MAGFMVKIELLAAEPSEYAQLRRAMCSAGFLLDGASAEKHGLHRGYLLTGDLTAGAVMDKAYAIASGIRPGPFVSVSRLTPPLVEEGRWGEAVAQLPSDVKWGR
ncbi:TPA: hypothetical protein ACKP12_004994 [Serratia marcescens]|uniref:hypothetical protein n=1 Tax=Serratia ureilytica TaxID=300181 RepID=UPI0018D6D237|nr:hypothetical protein [Serratia ureilytica]MBH2928762.1 hypothetical protein [Serratia ureilytica]